MDTPSLLPIVVAIAAVALTVLGSVILVAKLYRPVEQGKALIVSTPGGELIVSFTGRVVYPFINKAEILDISTKTLQIHRRGEDGLLCKDGVRADLEATFYLRVNKTQEDVIIVAQTVGCGRASDPKALRELFEAKFSGALEAIAGSMRFEEIAERRELFKDSIIEVIGRDLNGFVLDDLAIARFERTPT